MPPSIYQVGDTVTFSAVFRDTANNYIDPSGLVLKIMTPASATITYTYGTDATFIREAQGRYYATALITTGSASAAGVWRYWMVGTGVVKAAAQGQFIVEKNVFNP